MSTEAEQFPATDTDPEVKPTNDLDGAPREELGEPPADPSLAADGLEDSSSGTSETSSESSVAQAELPQVIEALLLASQAPLSMAQAWEASPGCRPTP